MKIVYTVMIITALINRLSQLSKPIFVKVTLVRKLLVNDYGTEFHKNWVNGLVVDGRSQTDGRDFHIKAFFFVLRKERLKKHPWLY